MVFSSTLFLVCFLPITIVLYYVIPSVKWKNLFLLLASLIFYAWGEPKYVFLMLASIVVNYAFGRIIYTAGQKQHRRNKWLLILAVFFNLGILVYFKYFNFIAETINSVFKTGFMVKNIALPIGISFFTFQGLSYVIDVWRDDSQVEEESIVQKNFIDLALYIAMFPQLIAGPIVRYHDIQRFLRERKHSFSQFASGIETFICGLAKKVLLANTLAIMVDMIMADNIRMIDMPQAWLGAFGYALQLYFDFSGYSEMAIGLGRMFGFEFHKNFDYPYISRSISEFWRRWHISLSRWFRDYLYIPLGGSKTGNVYFNLFIVFLATGIWHGAGFGFIVWGLWHGLFVIIERFAKNHHLVRFRIPSFIRWLYAMLVVYFGWILFRIVDLNNTGYYISVMFGFAKPEFVSRTLAYYLDSRTITVLIISVMCCIPWRKIITSRFSQFTAIEQKPIYCIVKRLLALSLLFVCYLFISNSTYNPFIYFRF